LLVDDLPKRLTRHSCRNQGRSRPDDRCCDDKECRLVRKGFHAASSSGGLLHTPARPRDIDGYCLLVAGAGILVHPFHVNVAASLPGIVFKLKPELVKSLSCVVREYAGRVALDQLDRMSSDDAIDQDG